MQWSVAAEGHNPWWYTRCQTHTIDSADDKSGSVQPGGCTSSLLGSEYWVVLFSSSQLTTQVLVTMAATNTPCCHTGKADQPLAQVYTWTAVKVMRQTVVFHEAGARGPEPMLACEVQYRVRLLSVLVAEALLQ